MQTNRYALANSADPDKTALFAILLLSPFKILRGESVNLYAGLCVCMCVWGGVGFLFCVSACVCVCVIRDQRDG